MKSRLSNSSNTARPPYRTSISGSPQILNRAKQIASLQGLTFSAFVVNVLQGYVAKHDRSLSKG